MVPVNIVKRAVLYIRMYRYIMTDAIQATQGFATGRWLKGDILHLLNFPEDRLFRYLQVAQQCLCTCQKLREHLAVAVTGHKNR